MERGAVDEPRSKESTTLEEQLDELCLYYMSIGVPYDEFWYGDYCSLKYYEETYLRQRKIRNEEMWMNGMYSYHGVAISLANAFRGKGQKAEEYMKEPIQFFPKSEKEKKAEEERIRQRVIDNLNALKEAWDGRCSKNSESTN